MNEWREYKLGDVCHQITDGKHGDCVNEGNSGFYFLSAKDIKDGKLSYDGVRQISKVDFEETHKRTNLKPGDILITNSGTIGRMAIAPLNAKTYRTTFQKSVAIIKPISTIIENKFCYYRLLTDFSRLVDLAGGTTQQNLLLGDLREHSISFPPLPEQRAIAGVLSSLDDKIDLLHRQNKTLEAMGETLWRKMFVEDADPNWKKGKLEEMVKSIETGRRPKGGIDPNLNDGIPSVGAENINGIGKYEYGKTKYVTEEYFSRMNAGIIQDYDILIYKDGAYIGKKSMFANGFPFKKCCINEHVFLLRTGKVSNQLFLYFVLEQEELEQLNANSAQPGLNQEALKSFEIIIPQKEVIEDFGSKVRPIVDKIFTNCIQIRTLSRLRDTLLPKLMSGEMRVKV